MQKLTLLVILAISCATSDRIYEDECPAVTPMPDFDMQKVKFQQYEQNHCI